MLHKTSALPLHLTTRGIHRSLPFRSTTYLSNCCAIPLRLSNYSHCCLQQQRSPYIFTVRAVATGCIIFVIFFSLSTITPDDANLLVPENSKVDVADESVHIKKWAIANKMVLNLAKTKEIIFLD